jgi:hypothetical protein
MSPEGRLCACGQPGTVDLYVRYAYPRAEYEPLAVDPHHVHGGGHRVLFCGNRFCERAGLVACREEIIDHFVLNPRPNMPSGLSAEQMAALELEVFAA